MATRSHTTDRVPGYSPTSLHVIRWTGLLTTDVGDWVTVPEYTDVTYQMILDSGTTLAALSIEGSNEVATPAAKNTSIINDSRGYGNPITWVFADGNKFKTALDSPLQIRPNFSGAGDSSVTVIASFKKAIF
jgi:hypothetical protein